MLARAKFVHDAVRAHPQATQDEENIFLSLALRLSVMDIPGFSLASASASASASVSREKARVPNNRKRKKNRTEQSRPFARSLGLRKEGSRALEKGKKK